MLIHQFGDISLSPHSERPIRGLFTHFAIVGVFDHTAARLCGPVGEFLEEPIMEQ